MSACHGSAWPFRRPSVLVFVCACVRVCVCVYVHLRPQGTHTSTAMEMETHHFSPLRLEGLSKVEKTEGGEVYFGLGAHESLQNGGNPGIRG